MSAADWYALVAVLVLLAASAFFTGAQVALLSLGKYRLRQLAGGGALGRTLARLLERPAALLSTLLVTITSLNFAALLIGAQWARGRLGAAGAGLVMLGLVLLALLVAELVPVRYAAANPERVARAAGYPVRAMMVLLFLPTAALVGAANLLTRLLGGSRVTEAVRATETEVLTLLNLDAERGLEEEERAMIDSLFDFGDKVARELMVPRTDMVAVPAGALVREAAAGVLEHRFTRLPVYEDDLDHILGIAYAKDMLAPLEAGQELSVSSIMREAYFVPETKAVAELLSDLRSRQQTMAIVLDEYGGTAGLITLEDLLEEVVGEIYDEYDIEHPLSRRLDEHTWLLDGKLGMEDAQDLLGVPLPRGDYDTLAGLLYDRLGSMAAVGDRVEVAGISFSVEQLHGRRIATIRALLPEQAGAGQEGERA